MAHGWAEAKLCWERRMRRILSCLVLAVLTATPALAGQSWHWWQPEEVMGPQRESIFSAHAAPEGHKVSPWLDTAGPTCRKFSHTVYLQGQDNPIQETGTACLRPDGVWEVVSPN